MEQIVVKTEVQNNGEILLYYVDENGESQQGIVTSLENVEHSDMEHAGIQIQDNYILSNLEDFVDESSLQAEVEEAEPISEWSDEETKRLLIFYVDNKPSFLVSGLSQRQHLWTVACKTMLIGKDPDSCEAYLNELRSKYSEVRAYTERGVYVKWEFLDLCHTAFSEVKHNPEPSKPKILNQEDLSSKKIAVLKEEFNQTKIVNQQNKIVKQINNRTPDDRRRVEQMLRYYLKYKHKFQHEHWRKDLWETIATELGNTEDGVYWQKRFLNFKQHYINKLLRKKEDSSVSLNWPYMALFDKIYEDDAEFHRKYINNVPESDLLVIEQAEPEHEWNTSHITILGKYYYDAYEEFEDTTIPSMFLWTEVGRIIEKKPESCKEKFASLHIEHINSYVAGGYSLQNRNAIAIILDSIIAKDVKKELDLQNSESSEDWQSHEVDQLVRFFYHDNLEAFKDPICHFVCWEAVSRKVNRDIISCKRQWDELVDLYKSILEEKKNDPDLQIDWTYIDMFDGIFEYGMDMKFMEGYHVEKAQYDYGKIGVKKVTIKEEMEEDSPKKTQNEKTNPPRTDPRSWKILEFYLKNKDKFKSSNSPELWDPLSKEIDMNTTQCAHRFRHLKQTYHETVQREIDHPKSIITWPYYALCKKVFGYRTVKNKLKLGNASAENEWLAREIRQLITFFSKSFHEINNSIDDLSIWAPLAKELQKTPLHCKDKFVVLRKCYRKLKTMKTRNPDVKISWSHFAMFDRIYAANSGEEEPMEVETLEEEHLEMDDEVVENCDDDYQCIIVLPDGQELTDISNAKIIIQNPGMPFEDIQEAEVALNTLQTVPEQPSRAWTKRTKKLLLIHYINYMRSHRGKKVQQKHLWDEIAAKIPNKTNIQCKKMFKKLKNAYTIADNEIKKSNPLHSLMEKVLKLKPNISITPIKDAKIQKTYKDVKDMDPVKIDSALVYYLNHIDDFVDPKFEKKYLWTELANHISEPVNKVYNKINYLKQAYNVETGEIDGQKTPYSDILNEIIVKEVSTKALLDQTKPSNDDDENWSDELTESLLTWYLGNLDKFKNPKFNRSYLWIEASAILNKSPVVCSKKMSEIRSYYRNIVRNNYGEMNSWQFLELCQKIYGTGKKSSDTDN